MAKGLSKKFGKYRLIAHLARGGMADIFLATQQSLGGFEKLIVIKRILPQLAEEEKFVQMFLDEARIAAMLNHPNVIQIFDVGRVEDEYYIAMEYLAGESLSRIIKACRRRKTTIPPALTAGIMLQAAEGLHHAHQMIGRDGRPMKIVHRDVSPQNIFVLYNGGVKVVDFGVAKAAHRSSKTRPGTLKGKYAYMSPEQVLNTKLDGRSDVFSLGVVMWECLTGRKLYRQESDYDILQAIVQKDAPSPHKKNPQVPSALGEITAKALARRREERYQAADDFHAALGKHIRQAGAEAGTMAVGRFMQDLFSGQIQEKRRLIDRARKSSRSMERYLFGDLRDYPSEGEGSVPDYTPSGFKLSRPMFLYAAWWRQPWVLLTIVGFVAVVGFVGSYLLASGNGSHPREERADASLAASAPVREAEPEQRPDAAVDAGVAAATAPADPTPKTDVETPAVAPKEKPKRHPGFGYLNLDTKPWTSIYLGKRHLGDTPIVGAKLRAGRRRLKAVNQAKGIERTFTVVIHRGRISKKRIEF